MPNMNNNPDPQQQDFSTPNISPSPTPPLAEKKKRSLSKKRWAAIAAAILVVLIGGGALAYTFWYQNPNKVLSDGFMNAIMAESVTYNGVMNIAMQGNSSTAVRYNGQSGEPGHAFSGSITVTNEDVEYKLDGDIVYMNDGAMYIKAGNLQNVYESFMEQSGLASGGEVATDVISKIDGQWIRIESSDTKELSDDLSSAQKCFSDATERARNDSSLTRELANVYREHTFITVEEELGVQDGSYGYVLGYDEAVANQFAEKVNETEFMRQLIACDEDYKLDSDDMQQDEEQLDATIKVWVTQFGHELSKIEVNVKDEEGDGAFTIEPTFNGNISIEAPANSMTFDELKNDIDALITEQYSTQFSAEEAQAL